MTPYYKADGIVIFHGDCRDVMEQWEGLRTQSFDLLLTDPPYGIASVWKGGFGHGWGQSGSESVERNAWDVAPVSTEDLVRWRGLARHAVIWGGNYFHLPPSRCWLVWSKPERGFSLAEAELAWTSFDAVVRVLDGPRHVAGRLHPTEKPEAVMRWALALAPDRPARVVDPYMGSGTTLVAAKRLGRTAVGIDIDERYCEIAAKRLSQGALPLEVA